MATVRQIMLVVLIVASLAGAALVLPAVNAGRDQLSGMSFKGTDPSRPEIVLLTHLLGGFKGLLVDAVWLRAVKLQQANKFWELYQLYDWMGKLEPHIEEIWDFNGWNMSYNLVAELPDSEARWQWIMRAIEWLRDQGLRYNPKSGKIMERIAWIFFHKIGRDLDLHHFYYKHRWALIMHSVLLTREAQDIPALAAAPQELETLLADPDVASVLSGFSLNPPEQIVRQIDNARHLADLPKPIGDAIANAKNAVGRDKLRHYISARILRTQFKMNRLDVMVEMEKKFGKFDWRLPEPHAIYWATLALEADPNPKKRINYDRLVMYSLQETMRRGNIAYLGPDPSKPMVTAFDLSKIAPLDKLYEEQMQIHSIERQDIGAESVRDGHIHFLQEAAFDLYFAGYRQEALKYHLRLYKLYNKPDPYMELDEYVLGRVKKLVDEFGTHAKVRAFVDGCIFQGLFYLCTNKPDEARKFLNLAERAWEAYCEYTEAQAQGRIRAPRAGLPPYKAVLRENIRNILLGRTPFPRGLLPILRGILKVPEGAEVEKLDIQDTAIAPPIPPSSPPPK